MTAPVWARTAKAGDPIYAQTAFPVAVNNMMAIPPGTYVAGQIDAMTRPGFFSPHAQFQIHFTKLIFANGYTVVPPGATDAGAAQPGEGEDVYAAIATPYVDVSAASDILLDNGTQMEMVLQVPLTLDASSVAGAARLSRNLPLPQFKTATLCRPTPGTPGTPDTVIPGTPGTPGTPDIVIPGALGMPDTVIPGTPATPGTPDTVIPGTPGTPDMVCPGPPVVGLGGKVEDYLETFQVSTAVAIEGKQLSAGGYQVAWKGMSSPVMAEILMNKALAFPAQARIVLLNRKSSANAAGTHANPDGSVSLDSLRFAGQNFALYFDNGSQAGSPAN